MACAGHSARFGWQGAVRWGGVYTALQTTAEDRVLFLACDMPFVTVELIESLIELRTPKAGAIFTRGGAGGKVGFPFILGRSLLEKVKRQLAERRYSLQTLARRCRAKVFTARLDGQALCNVKLRPRTGKRPEGVGKDGTDGTL